MHAFFKELFDYNHHCNQMLGEIFSGSPGKTSEKAVQLYNHILNAHQIWNNRIDPRATPFGTWDIHMPGNLQEIESTNHEHSLMILDRFDLDQAINYTNTKGLTFTNSIRDTLFHVINHSTYHRAQIATELKQNGMEPLNTDYIFFKR